MMYNVIISNISYNMCFCMDSMHKNGVLAYSFPYKNCFMQKPGDNTRFDSSEFLKLNNSKLLFFYT